MFSPSTEMKFPGFSAVGKIGRERRSSKCSIGSGGAAVRRGHALSRAGDGNDHDTSLTSELGGRRTRDDFHGLDGPKRNLVGEDLALLIGDRLTVHGVRVARMIAQPWNRPFESAATPGVMRVTSELRDEDWLSKGTLLNRFLSTSVWKVGSFSSKSVAVPSTVTLVGEPVI